MSPSQGTGSPFGRFCICYATCGTFFGVHVPRQWGLSPLCGARASRLTDFAGKDLGRARVERPSYTVPRDVLAGRTLCIGGPGTLTAVVHVVVTLSVHSIFNEFWGYWASLATLQAWCPQQYCCSEFLFKDETIIGVGSE